MLCLDRGREGGVIGTRGAEKLCEAGEQNLPAERSIWVSARRGLGENLMTSSNSPAGWIWA